MLRTEKKNQSLIRLETETRLNVLRNSYSPDLIKNVNHDEIKAWSNFHYDS